MTCRLSLALGFLVTAFTAGGIQANEPIVPGTGQRVQRVGDDFENPGWKYVMNGQKASYEQDEEQRPPGGFARNRRWYESAMRGQPDVVRRVPTPPGGIEGSQGALLLATRLSGIPGTIAGTQMQDDLLMGVAGRIGRPVPVGWSPNCTVRVFLPPFDKWENRTGASFGIRADVRGRTRDGEVDAYWPGFFILFRSKNDKRFAEDFAQINVRAQPSGRDRIGPKIYQPGWWTFGLSLTPDGKVHFYASEGVDDLTEEDHLYSSFPYGSRCLLFDNFFFNVANWENGKNWSTPWVIDDPQFFVIPPEGLSLAQLLRPHQRSQANRRSAPRTASNPIHRFQQGWKR